jgi:hypothetical protein
MASAALSARSEPCRYSHAAIVAVKIMANPNNNGRQQARMRRKTLGFSVFTCLGPFEKLKSVGHSAKKIETGK